MTFQVKIENHVFLMSGVTNYQSMSTEDTTVWVELHRHFLMIRKMSNVASPEAQLLAIYRQQAKDHLLQR